MSDEATFASPADVDSLADDDVDPQYVDVLLDLAYRRMEQAGQDRRDLDNKGFYLLATNGVLLGLLASVWSDLEPIFGTISLSFIVITFLLASRMLCLRKYRVWHVEKVWNKYTPYRNDLEKMKVQIYDEICTMDDQWAENIDEVADIYELSLATFSIAIILAALSLILSLLV